MEFRIGHLAYLTADMEATLAFYVGALGFTHAFSLADDNGQPWIEYTMSPDGRFVEFFYATAEEAHADTGSFRHLCLEVDDCAAAVAELEKKGIKIDHPVSQGKDTNFQAWITDPDGRPIELMQVNPTSGQFKARAAMKK